MTGERYKGASAQPQRGELAKFARHRGVSLNTVRRRYAKGDVPIEADGTVDFAKADQAWEETARRPVKPKPGQQPELEVVEGETPAEGEGQLITFSEAKRRNELAHAREREIKVLQLQGELVHKGTVSQAVFQWFRQERDSIRNLPARHGPRLAAKLGLEARVVIIELEAIIHEYLTERGDIEYPALA